MRLLCLLALAPLALAADDDGFKPLLDKDLTGWKAQKGEALDGKAEAFKGRFKLADGVLVLDPKVKGIVIIETAREIKGDAVIRFDFEPGAKCNNDLYLRGQKFDIKLDDGKTKEAVGVKQGEWNTMEIVAKGDAVEFLINGKSMRKAKAKGTASPFAIRAEFGDMKVRKLRIKEGG